MCGLFASWRKPSSGQRPNPVIDPGFQRASELEIERSRSLARAKDVIVTNVENGKRAAKRWHIRRQARPVDQCLRFWCKAGEHQVHRSLYITVAIILNRHLLCELTNIFVG